MIWLIGCGEVIFTALLFVILLKRTVPLVGILLAFLLLIYLGGLVLTWSFVPSDPRADIVPVSGVILGVCVGILRVTKPPPRV